MLKIVILVVILAVFGAFVLWLFTNLNNSQKETGPINLIVWGFDDEQVAKSYLQNFESQNPNVKITYTKQSLINYRTRVQTQIRDGVGPDVFLIHNSWLPMFEADLTPSPNGFLSIDNYKKDFYPVVAESLVKDEKIYGMPVNIDGLVLFVNEDILTGAGATIPKNWREFVEVATKVTVRDTNGQIKTAGASLGSTKNIDFWSEILGLLMFQQPGVNIASTTSAGGAEVLRFYTSFINDPSKKTWDITLGNSTEMFAEGKLAFYFGNFDKIAEFQAKNPALKFKVVSVPQLSETKANWGDFWSEVVSIKSAHPKEAWELVKYLSSSEVVRESGKPSARVELAPEQIQNPNFEPFISQAPFYKSWYLNHLTQDAGLNDEMVSSWQEITEKVLSGQNPQDGANNLANSSSQILKKYNVAK